MHLQHVPAHVLKSAPPLLETAVCSVDLAWLGLAWPILCVPVPTHTCACACMSMCMQIQALQSSRASHPQYLLSYVTPTGTEPQRVLRGGARQLRCWPALPSSARRLAGAAGSDAGERGCARDSAGEAGRAGPLAEPLAEQVLLPQLCQPIIISDALSQYEKATRRGPSDLCHPNLRTERAAAALGPRRPARGRPRGGRHPAAALRLAAEADGHVPAALPAGARNEGRRRAQLRAAELRGGRAPHPALRSERGRTDARVADARRPGP